MGTDGIAVRHWSHVFIQVADMEASLRFYRDLLGAETFSDDAVGGADFESMIGVPGARARIVNLVVGGQKVELIAVEGVPQAAVPARAARGLAGFAVRVDDIERAHAFCLEYGATLESAPTEIHGFRHHDAVALWHAPLTEPSRRVVEAHEQTITPFGEALAPVVGDRLEAMATLGSAMHEHRPDDERG